MKQVPIKVKKLHKDAVIPQYQTDGSAGFDLHTVEFVMIEPGETKLIRSGLSFEIPEGYVMFVMPRSGVSLKTKLRQSNSIGVIDSDYRGEVKMMFDNNDDGIYVVHKGERIAQGVIQAVPQAVFEEVDELKATERGTGGFGSTGVGA